MVEAKKENKVYTIDESMKDRYLKDGFDIYKNGVIVEHTPKKMIKFTDHLEAIAEKDAEISKLKEEIKKLKKA